MKVLLLLARFDSGRVELSLAPVDLRAAAGEALDDAALIARSRGVTLVNEVPAGLAAAVYGASEGLRTIAIDRAAREA